MRPSVLVLALLVSAPSVWAALGTQQISVETALVHFLVAVPVMAVLSGLVRLAMQARQERPASRSAKMSTAEDGQLID